MNEKSKNILLIIMLIALIGIVVFSDLRAGSDRNEIERIRDELKCYRDAITELGAENLGLRKNVTELSGIRWELERNNIRLRNTITELRKNISGAGSELQQAFNRVRELKEIAKEIEN